MATTGQNFVLTGGTGTYLSGATVVTAPFVLGLNGVAAQDAVNAAPPSGSGVASGFTNNSATSIDRTIMDLAMLTVPPGIGTNLLSFGDFIGGYAKNGALYVTFTGTTAVNVDFTALSTAIGVTSSQAGDTTLASIGAFKFKNVSSVASNIAMILGASNPSRMPPMTGTGPTVTLLPGDIFIYQAAVPLVVDSTHKILTFTPTAAGAMLLSYGGA